MKTSSSHQGSNGRCRFSPGHVASQHRGDGLADRGSAMQQTARPLHTGRDSEVFVSQQLRAFAGPLCSQQRIFADHQAL